MKKTWFAVALGLGLFVSQPSNAVEILAPEIPEEYEQIFQLVESAIISYYFPATAVAFATCQVDTSVSNKSVTLVFHDTHPCPISGTLEFENSRDRNSDYSKVNSITRARLNFKNLQYIKALDFDAYLTRETTMLSRSLHYLILNGRVAIQPEPYLPTVEFYVTGEGQRQKTTTSTTGSSRSNVFEKRTLDGFTIFTTMDMTSSRIRATRSQQICALQDGTPNDVDGGTLTYCVKR